MRNWSANQIIAVFVAGGIFWVGAVIYGFLTNIFLGFFVLLLPIFMWFIGSLEN